MTSEIFEWGGYGGFGRVARLVGTELLKRGYEVTVVTPRWPGQRQIEQVDGMTVLSFKRGLATLLSGHVFARAEADVYELIDAYSVWRYIAARAIRHVPRFIWFQDPWEPQYSDVWVRTRASSWIEKIAARVHFEVISHLGDRVVRASNELYCSAEYLIPIVRKMHKLQKDPGFLPQPILTCDRPVTKSSTPVVCFLARWDPVKRVERVLELARSFPHVQFTVMGVSIDPARDAMLRRYLSQASNIELPGLVIGDEKDEILRQSWVLVNTAFHEGLPNSFLEAWTNRCAVLSAVNPGGLVERFGYAVEGDDFESGLGYLLEHNRWKTAGEEGAKYVNETYELAGVVDQHEEIFARLAR